MKTLNQTLGISLIIISLLFTHETFGQKRSKTPNRTVKTERNYKTDRVNSDHNRYHDRYRTQPVRRHPHYRYPRHRRVITTLPRHHVRVVYRGLPYFYYSGIYYTSYGNDYIVVLPPRGFRISVLPVGHVRIVVGPTVYFYHSGIYYVESSTSSSEVEGNYEVTRPPVGVVVETIHEDSKEVNIDGKTLYEYNDTFYKKLVDLEGNTSYEVVYSKSESES